MYTEREVRGLFEKVAKTYNITALVGPRQSGKTTFLKERAKGVDSSYVLFDDPDARQLFEDDVKRFENQYMEGKEVTVMDEVQYCKDAGKKLKYLADRNKKIWLTSSSEIILGKEILSYLVGRVSVIRLYPFSLREYVSSIELTEAVLERKTWEHITYGGYPKAATNDDVEMKKIILKDLYETMILKDIARTFSIEDINSLEELSRYISANTGMMLSYDKISMDIKISFQTLKKYLDAMEKSYLTIRIPPFFKNKSKEITKQPKIYFIDTGLRNAISKTFENEPSGQLFENYVLTELLKAGYSPKYWRSKSKAEVDFIIEKNNQIIPVEAKLSGERIERSMKSFIEIYKPKNALIVRYKNGEVRETTIKGCRVRFISPFEIRRIFNNSKF